MWVCFSTSYTVYISQKEAKLLLQFSPLSIIHVLCIGLSVFKFLLLMIICVAPSVVSKITNYLLLSIKKIIIVNNYNYRLHLTQLYTSCLSGENEGSRVPGWADVYSHISSQKWPSLDSYCYYFQALFNLFPFHGVFLRRSRRMATTPN